MPLNYLQCVNAKPKSKPYKLSDGNSLYLQIMPTGKRYWQYRFHLHGKQRCLSLGTFPTMSIADARNTIETVITDVKQHIDPVLKRQEEKQLAKYQSAQTFKAIALEWHELNKDSWTERHANYVLRRLELHTFSSIGNYPINKLTPAILTSCFQKVEKTGPEMARRVLNMCSRIFKYACATGRAERDLTFGLETVLKKYRSGHYAAITLDELPILVRKIYTNDARLFRQTHLCLKLMLLTAVRTCELIEARWSEINFENDIWVIPAERMKTRKLHKVPLSKQALAILRELKELNGKRDFVFPSIARPRKPMSNATLLKALAALGYKHKMTGHGFRSILMGVCKQHLGYRHEPVDRQLAHVPRNSVDRAYDRADYLPERIVMMQEYADYIDCILNNKPFQRRSKDDRNNSPTTLGFAAATPYINGYTTGISYRTAGFTQTMDFRQIPETAQRPGEQAKLLVERRDHYPLQ